MANNWEGFPSVSVQQWRDAIEKELKGQPYDSIRWKSPEGIIVEPFYAGASEPVALAAIQPWKIAAYISVRHASEANKTALRALEGGAEVIIFDLNNTGFDQAAISKLVEGIFTEIATVYFYNAADPLSFYTPPVQNSIIYGNSHDLINMRPDHYAEENMVEELAGGLFRGHELLVKKIGSGQKPADAANGIHFLLSCGNRYLFEICKIRALKWLWMSLAKQYGAEIDDVTIIAESSTRNFSGNEPYNNMIKNTAQVMSAVLGGASMVYAHTHDTASMPGFGERIAQNIQHLLKEESYIAHVLNAVEGAWFFDSITVQLAEKAWDKFRMNKTTLE